MTKYLSKKNLKSRFQEDKDALFDTFDNINYIIKISTEIIQTLTINKEKMYNALIADFLVNDVVNYLIKKGVSFS